MYALLGAFALAIPAISLMLAGIHYRIIFSAMESSHVSILTLSDHFDKAAEIFVITFGAAASGFFAGSIMRGAEIKNLKNKSEEEIKAFYKKKDDIKQKIFLSAFSILLVYYVFSSLFLSLPYPVFGQYFWVPLVAWAWPELELSFSDFGKSNTINSTQTFFSVLFLTLLFVSTSISAHFDAYRIREMVHESTSEEVVFFDAIEAGYLNVEDGKLVLRNDSMQVVLSMGVRPPEKRNGLCRLGAAKFCPPIDSN